MDTIKLFNGRIIPAQIITTERIFQVETFDGDYILCNLDTAQLLISGDECKRIKHYWNYKFTTIGKKEVRDMPSKVPNYRNGQDIEILCHDHKSNSENWRKGKVINIIPATDIDYRIEVELDNHGPVLSGHSAAHPDCVRPIK
jgi:hypothetical protein